ncbi:MAG: DNA-processing protein DprA [Reyranellaceae bacterium]
MGGMPDAVPVSPFNEVDRLAALRLARGAGIGPILYGRLIARFGSPSRALAALPGLAARTNAKASAASAATAEREMRALAKLGGRLLVKGEADYPPQLASLSDAPPVLSILGDVAALRRTCIAIVGARDASVNGRQLAEGFARALATRGYAVVSGLARGIDTAAHLGALSAEGGATVAVMAGGVDHVYPRENEPVFRRIVDGGGAVIAETALGAEPTARHFPRRNRIVSGLSRGVVVVEAAARSGSLITARLAAEQGREVFAVPGSPLDPRCHGCNGLIREGAWLTETVEDIVANMPQMAPAPAPILTPVPTPAPTRVGKEVKTGPEKSVFPHKIQIDEVGSQIVALLSSSPTAVDEILRQCQTSPSIVAGVLLELELTGRLERHPGNAVSLVS